MVNEQEIALERLLKEHLDPINKKMVEQEKARHQQFLDQHFGKYDQLAERQDSYKSQLITLEVAIFGAVVVFTNSQDVTAWLILSLSLILVSLIFGLISKNMYIQSSFQLHESDYYEEMRHHWWLRELWKDETVKEEKKLFESQMADPYAAKKDKLSYKLLKLFRLNADRVERIFFVSLIAALITLMLHLLSKL